MKERPKRFEVRPIGARALKSAQDSLRPYLDGARVCDLFSGQGRFGFAALEENAREVHFVEQERKLCAEITRHGKPFDGRFQVHCTDVFRYLGTPALGCFDVIFADPPFPLWEDEAVIDRLYEAVRTHLQQNSIFLVKKPSRVLASPPRTAFKSVKQSVFGESTLVYLSLV